MIDLAEIPGILRKRLPWLILSPIVFMALALAYLMMKSPVYYATSQILIEPKGLKLLSVETKANQGDQQSQGIDIDSQIYVLLSSPVLNDVADKLDLDNDPTMHARPSASGQSEENLGGTSMTERRAATLAVLRKNIYVNRLNSSFVFEITAQNRNPRTAAAIANEVAQSYIVELRKTRKDALQQAGRSLSDQAGDLLQRLQKAEAAVEAYKSKNGLISTGTNGLVVDQQLEGLNSRITEAQVDLERAKTAYDRVRTLTLADVEAGGFPQAATNTVLSSLRVQYARIAEQEAQAATTLGANHPSLRELRSQLSNTKQQIDSELERMKQSLKGTYEQAKGTLAALQAQSQALQTTNAKQGEALIKLRQLESDVEASRTVYDAFLQRARELQEQPEMGSNATRVLARAQVPTSPSGPRKIIVIAAAGLFGVAFAAGLAILFNLIAGQVTSANDLARRTGVPVLTHLHGTSPRRQSLSKRLLHRLPLLGGQGSDTAYRVAIARLAYALKQSYEDTHPANILILATHKGTDLEALGQELADQLFELGEDVLFAKVARHQSPDQLPKALLGTKRGKANKRGKQLSEPQKKRLDFLRKAADLRTVNAPATEQPETPSEPSSKLRRYLQIERIGDHPEDADVELGLGNEDFLLVNTGSVADSPILPVLLRHCDGILLVTELGETSLQELDETLSYLHPWQDRVIGNVVLQAA